MLKQTIVGLLLAAAGLLVHHTAHADIFRCVDAAGNALFTDLLCPSGTRTTDVTTAVQVCGSADCERRLERDYQEAQERRRREQEQLAILKEERRRREEEDARLEALQSREAVAPEPVAPVESVDPGYPIIVGVPWWNCVGVRCFPRPHHSPHRPGDPDRDRDERRVSNDPDHRHHHDPHAPDPHPGTTHADGRHDGRSSGHDGQGPADNRPSSLHDDGAPLGAAERPPSGRGRS